MGKKRDRPFESAPKRRTKLQIGSASSSTKKDNAGTGAFGATFQEASKPQNDHNPLSGLLGHYGDSDDENSPEEQGSAGEPNKPKNEIDAKVADFLAEIDALDGIESPGTSGETSEAQSKQMADDSTTQGYAQQDSTPAQAVESTSDLAYAPAASADAEHMAADSTNGDTAPADTGEWQEILDETTNCVYYWNTVTSEVTWEMPEVLRRANQQLASQSYGPPAANGVAAAAAVAVTAAATEPKGSSDPATAPADAVAAPQQEKPREEEEGAATAPSESDAGDDGGFRKLPVYGPGRVEYDLSPEPAIEDEEEDFELQKPEARKPAAYPMFVKGDTLPGSDASARAKPEEAGAPAISQARASPAQVAEGSTNGGEDSRGDGAEEDMDIDEELEQALERRKAELRQLEGEGTASPQAPEMKRKASDSIELYDEKGEVNLLAFKKKRMENLRSNSGRRLSGETSDKSTQCDQDLMAKAKAKEEAELKKEITQMSSTLESKLRFLGITRKDLTKFHIMLIEKEVRIRDWREGSLSSKHLLRHLKSSAWEFERYELEAAPPGWSCNWDRYDDTNFLRLFKLSQRNKS